MRDSILLHVLGQPMRVFALNPAGLLVGRSSTCDITLHHDSVPPIALRIHGDGENVTLEEHDKPPVVMHYGRRFSVGECYALERVHGELTRSSIATEPLGRGQSVHCPKDLALVVAHKGVSTRYALGERPITIGRSKEADITLDDAAISGVHCRIECWRGQVWICDLESRNGTRIDERRIMRAEFGAGSRAQIGRTELRLVRDGLVREGKVKEGKRTAQRHGLIAASDAMKEVLGKIELYAGVTLPALLIGESGVGKEIIARALHDAGPRAKKPFVAINGGGLTEGLVESELFGHERGAFTGADRSRKGAFELAEGGTLFLDEVGELSLASQARLLRVLERWEIRKVGGEALQRVDVRLVCATHRDLRKMIQEGKFREDLFYRICKAPIQIPPLRERKADIPPLAQHFLELHRGALRATQFSPDALRYLGIRSWPGNVRQLKSVVDLSALHAKREWITLDDLCVALDILDPSEERCTDDHLVAVVTRLDGNLSAAARALKIPRSTLRDRLERAQRGTAQAADGPPAQAPKRSSKSA